jgi:hypothetical protein
MLFAAHLPSLRMMVGRDFARCELHFRPRAKAKSGI